MLQLRSVVLSPACQLSNSRTHRVCIAADALVADLPIEVGDCDDCLQAQQLLLRTLQCLENRSVVCHLVPGDDACDSQQSSFDETESGAGAEHSTHMRMKRRPCRRRSDARLVDAHIRRCHEVMTTRL